LVLGGRYLLSADNHSSVNGIREFARSQSAEVIYAPLRAADLRLDCEALRAELDRPAAGPRGLASTFADAHRLVQFVGEFVNRPAG
jgi:hypothetical protein